MLLGGTCFESPLKSVNFLEAYPSILHQRFEVASLQDCLDSAGNHAPSAFIRHLPGLGTATHNHVTGLVCKAVAPHVLGWPGQAPEEVALQPRSQWKDQASGGGPKGQVSFWGVGTARWVWVESS